MTVQPKIAVLFTNLGTPDACQVSSVRKYLKEFLSDPHVVDLPKWLWLPFLYGFVLPLRAVKSAKMYQKIWTENGSPLKVNMNKLIVQLKNYFSNYQQNISIFLSMRYGEPSLESILSTISSEGFDKLILFPLYPQYSIATTRSTVNKVSEILSKLDYHPEIQIINHYYDNAEYISAIADSIQTAISLYHPEKIMFSFHGLPEKFITQKNDPYVEHCKATVKLITEKLQLPKDKWILSFQSRFGKAKWVKPYTDVELINLAQQNIKNICVICPGFSVDCLETLEEINIQNRKLFLDAGGKEYHYIPCLNDDDEHVQMLANIVLKSIEG